MRLCRRRPQPQTLVACYMIRWILVIFVALIFISWFTPLLQKLGFGRLPGDFRFRLFGREWFIPLTTTLLLSAVASLIARWL